MVETLQSLSLGTQKILSPKCLNDHLLNIIIEIKLFWCIKIQFQNLELQYVSWGYHRCSYKYLVIRKLYVLSRKTHSDIQPILGCIKDINDPGFRPGLLILKPCRLLEYTEWNFL